jgi:outer membrane lipoprotein
MTRIACILLMLTLAGCASDIPKPIRDAPAMNIAPARALAEADSLKGQAVRWGGSIARVENRKDETWIEIVERPLARDGEPDRYQVGGGRFLARVPGFLDPEVYASKRLMTVAGTLDGITTRSIGEYPYRFPVVQVTAWYLWPPSLPPHYAYPPYGYGPYWHDPWYPWRPVYPYPYYYRYTPPRH